MDYILVPKEPTEEMLDAVLPTSQFTEEQRGCLRAEWSLMLATAPKVEQIPQQWRDAGKMAIEALENSIDVVTNEYLTDWRHGMPSRKAQLKVMREGVELHRTALAALRELVKEEE